MSEEQKSTGKNKLAQAMQDAAIESINEDINDIYTSIEKITRELPIHVKEQLASLKGDIESLEGALKSVPEQFDVDFSRKINRILDIASEVEFHTKKLNSTIQADNSAQIEKQAEQYASAFNRKIEDYTVTSFPILVIWGLLCAIVGGGIAGLMVWFVFPKIFM